MKREDLPKARDILFKKGYLIIPLVAIIWLLTEGATPMKAAMWAIIISICIASLASLVNLVRKKAISFGPRDIVLGMEAGAKGALGVISACACAGIIIGVVTKTGLGLKLGEILVSAAGGKLFLTQAVFEGLSPEFQKALVEAASEGADFNNRLTWSQEDDYMKKLEKAGVKINKPEFSQFTKVLDANIATLEKKWPACKGLYARIQAVK